MTYIERMESIVKIYYPDTEIEYFSFGDYAYVFKANNRVIKVTIDQSEYTFASLLVNNHKKEFVYVYNTIQHNEYDEDENENLSFYIIEAEFVETVNDTLDEMYIDFREKFNMHLKSFLADYQRHQKSRFIKNILKRLTTFKFKKEVYQLIRITKQIKQFNMMCIDMHMYNVGVRNNNEIVLLDLGCMHSLKKY